MSTRDVPNPLRPYYKPPSIGIPQDVPTGGGNATSAGSTHGLGPKNGSAASYASSARDMFSDIDYSDYLSDSSPSSFETLNRQINEWMYRYFSILLGQPFDVAKTILQVKSQATLEGAFSKADSTGSYSRSSSRDEIRIQNLEDEDSDPDELAYFTSSAPHSANSNYDSFSRSRQRPQVERDYSPSPSRRPSTPPHVLTLKHTNSILEVISQEWTKEGVWGVWKASNSTFIYGLLHQTLEKWSRGMIAAILNVPDQGLGTGIGAATELADSPYPWASLGVAIAAGVTAGLILAPLDLVRTKLILTSVTTPSRSLTQNVRNLPSYLINSKLLLPTAIYEFISPTIHHATPLLLRSYLSLDPVLTPNSYSIAKFFSRTVELFLKLPFETVLRRAQIEVLSSQVYNHTSRKGSKAEFEPIVSIGEYRGVFATMWCIVREEGYREEVSAKKGKAKGKIAKRKGQGVEGLWRGWRVGMWGLVGVWGAGMLGGNGSGGEF